MTTQVANDFKLFQDMPAPSGGGGTPAGRDPRLAELDRTMAQAGFAPQDFWSDAFDTGKKVFDTGKKIWDIGKGLGLFSEGPEAELEVQFLDSFLRSQVEQLIKTLRDYVNRYGGLVECVPLVTRCVEQFGAGQYAAALSTGYQAYNCITAKL